MTFNELYAKILEICPNAFMGEDADGQLVVNTGKRMEGVYETVEMD
jgi:hypothetical protein